MATSKPQRIPISYIRLVNPTSTQEINTTQITTSNNKQQQDLSESSVYPHITNEDFFMKLPTPTNNDDASNNNASWFNEFLANENEPSTTTTTSTTISTPITNQELSDDTSLTDTLTNESEPLSTTTTQTSTSTSTSTSSTTTTTIETPQQQQKLTLQQCLHEAHANDDCSICMGPLSETPISEVAITPCGHTFCQDCLEGVFENAIIYTPTTSPDCPYCRQEIKTTNVEEEEGYVYFMEKDGEDEGLILVISTEGVFGRRIKLEASVKELGMEQVLEIISRGDLSWRGSGEGREVDSDHEDPEVEQYYEDFLGEEI